MSQYSFIVVLHGYPPKEIGCYNDKLLVADVGIKAGDTVTLQELQESRESQVNEYNYRRQRF